MSLQLEPLAVLLLVLVASALVINVTVRLFSRWLSARVPVLDEPVRQVHITLDDPLAPEPFVEQCACCEAFLVLHASRCWRCKMPVRSKSVDARPTEDDTWPGGKSAA